MGRKYIFYAQKETENEVSKMAGSMPIKLKQELREEWKRGNL